MKLLLFIPCFLIFLLSSFAQDSTVTSSKFIPSMAEEIANLTRRPLGEGTLNFERFIMYTVEDHGKSRAGKIYFSNEHEAVVWLEDINRDENLFFRATPESSTITITPSIKQGSELSPELIKALGYADDIEPSETYITDKEIPVDTIANSECQAAVALLDELKHTMWVALKKSFKKADRQMLERGIRLIFNNQTRSTFLSSAIVNDSWIPLGFNCDSYQLRIINWGTDGEFKIEQKDLMIKILGLDLNQVAKKYIDDLNKEERLQKED